jgi:hypothetical protein
MRKAVGPLLVVTCALVVAWGVLVQDADAAVLVASEVRRVHLADFDGDGRADRLAHRPESGEWQTWTAMGGPLDAGQWPLGFTVQAANFNSDRLADLFLYNPLSGDWFQLVNSGESFLSTAGTSLADADVYLGDLDGDGDDDVLLYQTATGRWSRGVNDGQGQFAFTSGQWTAQLTMRVADFDADSRADIFTYERASGRWSLTLSRPSGGTSILEGATLRDREVSIANLDDDGRADVLFHDSTTGGWEIWVSDGPGAFHVGATGVWAAGLAVQLADLTGDGLDEALLYEPRTGTWTVTPLTAAASGLSATGTAPAGATLASGDIDGDGFAELYLYQPQSGAVLLIDPEPTSALQVMSAAWPIGWTLQGYAVEASLATPAQDIVTVQHRDDDAIDAEDARAAALQAVSLQRTPSAGQGSAGGVSVPLAAPQIAHVPVAVVAGTRGPATPAAVKATPAVIPAPPVPPRHVAPSTRPVAAVPTAKPRRQAALPAMGAAGLTTPETVMAPARALGAATPDESVHDTTTPPAIAAPKPVTVEATSANGAEVSDAQLGTFASGSVTLSRVPAGDQFSVGTTTIIWIATDKAGKTTTFPQQMTVRDTTAPAIETVTANVGRLLPPSHEWVPITLSVMASDLVDPAPACRITGVTRNNAPKKHKDDPDWRLTGDLTISVRAEQSDQTPDLADTISIVCTDRLGNSAVGSTNVPVPHDRDHDRQARLAAVLKAERRR